MASMFVHLTARKIPEERIEENVVWGVGCSDMCVDTWLCVCVCIFRDNTNQLLNILQQLPANCANTSVPKKYTVKFIIAYTSNSSLNERAPSEWRQARGPPIYQTNAQSKL